MNKTQIPLSLNVPRVDVAFIQRWLKGAAPFLTIVGSGVLFFHEALVASVENSPHPQLVYIMLGVFLVGALANLRNLSHNIQDALLVQQWSQSPVSQYAQLREQLPATSLFTPVLKLLAEDAQDPLRSAMIDGEMFTAEKRMSERASLPEFLGSAMIGLGLVGTFIGLLSVLQDLAGLFSVMSGPQAASADSASVFGQLVQKLQEPMRGMGTAFLASLYGLSGSLILGVLMMSVKRSGHQATSMLRDTIYEQNMQNAQTFSAQPAARPASATGEQNASYSTPEIWQTLLLNQQQEHQAFIQTTSQTLQSMTASLEHIPQLVQALQQRSEIDQHVQKLMGQGAHWHDAWEQIADQLQQLRSQSAMDGLTLQQTLSTQAQQQQQLIELGQSQLQQAQQRDAQLQSLLSQNKLALEHTASRLRSLTAAWVDQTSPPAA